jgi:undecaprenyl diphosphate synthase
MIERQIDELDRRGARLRFLGRKAGLGEALARALDAAEERTKHNRAIAVNVALNYGGRADIVDAVRDIVQSGARPEDISEDTISANLSTAGQPDPDLIIRTAGEMRLSNFLVWQAAYAEYYSTPTLWPDFGREELLRALLAFQARHRRFGTLTEAS